MFTSKVTDSEYYNNVYRISMQFEIGKTISCFISAIPSFQCHMQKLGIEKQGIGHEASYS